MLESYLQLITTYAMDVNAEHVNGYIREAVLYVHITWILCWTELKLHLLHEVACDGIQVVSYPVGLGKPPSCKFHLKYLSNPYTINKYLNQ